MNRANADFVSVKVSADASADASAVSAAARPIVLITGAAGNLGRSVAAALLCRYRVVGLDL